MCVACLLVFAVQLGVQTLPFLLSGELFANDVRAVCKGLTRSVTCVLLIVSLKLYPVLQAALNVYGTFLLFAICMAASLPFVYCMLPETKDLGLEMIQVRNPKYPYRLISSIPSRTTSLRPRRSST